MDNHERLEKLAELIEEEKAWPAYFDDEGDLAVEVESKTFVFTFNDEEGNQLRVILPTFWHIDSPEEAMLSLKAMNDANAQVFGIKLFEREGWVTAEAQIIGNHEQFVITYIETLMEVAEMFVTILSEMMIQMFIRGLRG